MDTAREFYSIGDLAHRFGVSAESLRNWERQGLIPPPGRTPGKHRRYTEAHVHAVASLLNAEGAQAGELQHA